MPVLFVVVGIPAVLAGGAMLAFGRGRGSRAPVFDEHTVKAGS
jgi:hypothetical protein